jgi:pilus assembly protein CpaB
MNRRLVTILLSAFIVAALCSVLVYRLVGMKISANKPQPATSVVAAANDIKIGTVLAATDLKTVQIVGTAPKGAILDVKKAVGRGVTSTLYAGEPIMDDRLAPEGSGGGLAATIRDGMRAIAVRVDQVVGVAGFVLPGMRVDVLVSGVPPDAAGGSNNTQVRTILQNIEVLSAGTDIQKDAEGKPQQVPVVNLLVTPEQAQVLALASNETKIQLVLRNPLDTKVAPVQGTAMTNLFLDQNAPATKPHLTGAVKPKHKAAPEMFSVVVINGASKTEEKFASPGGKQ